MTKEAKVAQYSYEECLQQIIKNKNEKALNYAVNYARVGQGMTGHEAKVQCLYILNNMTAWRGETAKAVRESLKLLAKGV